MGIQAWKARVACYTREEVILCTLAVEAVPVQAESLPLLMATRSSHNWTAHKPGGWDTLNIEKGVFPASNLFGIPDLLPDTAIPLDDSLKLVPFHAKQFGERNICHFFLDDYQFERVWNRPSVYLHMLKRYYAVLTPDFSLYPDYPLACNLWNVYRNRWLGRYWQEHGLKVIPTVGWSDESSYSFAFCGVPHGSIVAISPPNLRFFAKPFYAGLSRMIDTISPSLIITYGSFDIPTSAHTNFLVFPKRWDCCR